MGDSLFVVIDGNNLAKYLYTLEPDTPITLETDRQLVAHLSGWAVRQARPVTVELCLDPRRQRPEERAGVQVYIACPPHDGDESVLDRVRVHVVNREACLVVSNDQELCEAAGEFQVDTRSVSSFVRRRDARRPAFAPAPLGVNPGRMPHEGAFNQVEVVECAAPPQGVSFQQRAQQFEGWQQARHRQAQIDQAIARTLSWQEACSASQHPASPASGSTTAAPGSTVMVPVATPARYRLTLETWPVSVGARFLAESFCPHHRVEIAPVVGQIDQLEANDLPVLAELLLECCAQETDFVRRGGSLMDRVRLALLAAGPPGLSLAELARQTSDAPAVLERKLRRTQGRWLAVQDSAAG